MSLSTEEHPKISVLICTYDSERYVGECLESVLAQTLPPLEIIVCDDHSTDGTWPLIRDFAAEHPGQMRPYRHERNLGQHRNGEFARSKVRGNYVTWIDGDDRWCSHKLEREWKALGQSPEARIAYSNVRTIDENGKSIALWDDGRLPTPPSGDAFPHVFSRMFYPNSPSLFRDPLMRREASDAENRVDLTLDSYWDWDIKIRLAARFALAYVPEPNVEYRVHNRCFHRQDPERHVRAMIRVYEKNEPLLSTRPVREQAKIRCQLEAALAEQVLRLPEERRPPEFLPVVSLERNDRRLRELSDSNRAQLLEEMRPVLDRLRQAVVRERHENGAPTAG